MSELASKGQLRMSFLRWALLTVPAILFLGLFMSRVSNSRFGNPWFDALAKPDWFPPGWLFGAVWSVLYILIGLAIAHILHARGAQGRRTAIGLFLVQLALNLSWTPVFFVAHQVTAALWLIMLILILAVATTISFSRIRKAAAWLMLPYLAWLTFATVLAWEMERLNPDAEQLKATGASTQIAL
ncbi:MAG: TspO/MBR family protein [Sphingomonadaceae bacterium]